MADTARRRMTVEEFLVWQESQDERYEFIDGAPRAMTGATHTHDIITANVLAGLHGQLKGKPCRVATSDIAVRIANGNLRRPDAIVECSTRTDGTVAHEPVVIVEVLSPTTRVLDQTVKFVEYQSLASLTHYVLVQQDRPDVSIYRRQDDGVWTFEVVSGLDGRITLDAVGVTLAVADLYDRIAFEPPGAPEALPR